MEEFELENKLLRLYDEHKELIIKNDTPAISQLRDKAFENFKKLGFPTRAVEEWRNTDLMDVTERDYSMYFEDEERIVDITKIFRCEVHNFETFLFTTLNGWYVYQNSPLTKLPSGAIVGSLAAAMQEYPELVEKHYGKYADIENNHINALNTAFAQDGVFIYIPDNVEVSKPIQIVNIVNIDEDFMSHTRNLVIVGKNSKLTLVHCDDSITHRNSFLSGVSEYYLDENSHVDFYKLQNKDDNSTLITNNHFYQKDNSTLTSNTITLNGGIIRNETIATLDGQNCTSNIFGLYLMDREQHVDNRVFVDHAKPNSFSDEMFKGIIDDDASASFNGHILVRKDAQQTNAFQNNKNIALTDTAKINTKPFLEIYADDVKCSHGATVGQLDPEAMFYIRSRGICEKNARMLLMYAFAAEVVNKIKIEVLRERIDNMVQKRLKGELSICDQCVLHCKDEREIHFNIDLSKV
jgi:Fe-S cluster assembly protein SufD